MGVIRSHLTGWLDVNPENKQLPIPPVPQGLIARAMEGKIAQNVSEATATIAAAAAAGQESSGGDDSKPKKTDFASMNGTEDVVVMEEDVEMKDDEMDNDGEGINEEDDNDDEEAEFEFM